MFILLFLSVGEEGLEENCERNFLSQINYSRDKEDKYDEYTTVV